MNGTTLIENPGVEALIEILHQERRVLERLVFRLSEANLMVAAREDRYLALAADEVLEIEEELGEVEMLRAVMVAGIAESWNTDESELTLQRIIAESPAGLTQSLEQHLESLKGLTDAIQGLKHSIADLTRQRLSETRSAIQAVTASGRPTGYYDRSGASRSGFSAGSVGAEL